MITYEFRFKNGQTMTGEGNDPAEALLDAYRRNGFLPNSELMAKINISRIYPLEQEVPPEPNRKGKTRK